MDLCRVWNTTSGKNSMGAACAVTKQSEFHLNQGDTNVFPAMRVNQARTKGFSRISSPRHVSGPCPATTVAPSSSV